MEIQTICEILAMGILMTSDTQGKQSSSRIMELAAPIDRWDEAIPLGNGLLGGLLWGEGNTLRLSLDRGDLWDLRIPEPLLREDWTYRTIRQLVAEGRQDKISELFDRPYNDFPYPTKIPAGRLEISLMGDNVPLSFSLDLDRAVGSVQFKNGVLEVFYSADEPMILIRSKDLQFDCRLVSPSSLQRLGYGPPATGNEAHLAWSVQEAALGCVYAVVLGERETSRGKEMALTITSTEDDKDPLKLGKQRVNKALERGYEAMLAPHASWWKDFWSRSSVHLPDPRIQNHYDLVQYFYGAASRRGAPPIPLQGVWTADEGNLPPWHGDYHHDLNTQLTYWAYLSAGRFEEGNSFLDFMWDLFEEHQGFAKTFYDSPGIAVPGVMTLNGKAMGGWSQYSLSPTNGAWVAQAFYLHWKYTMDEAFLQQRAYPYCQAVAECLASLLSESEKGNLLPLSSSPEIHDNRMEAWLTPNSTFDLSLLRWLFAGLEEMARYQGKGKEARYWEELLHALDDLPVDEESKILKLSSDESLMESHRHFSHLMAIHPLGTLHVEGSDRDREVVAASLGHLENLGTKAWCGYSFSWMACMAARAGQSDKALHYLDLFVDAFISRNGFHLNGDQKKAGHSNFTYRPFTLEGNFAAAQAVHEMLLHSWGDTLRIFPAIPPSWKDVSFEGLWAEGAFRVWAERKNGTTTRVRIEAQREGRVTLQNPFHNEEMVWNREIMDISGSRYTFFLHKGESLEGWIEAGGTKRLSS